MANCITTFCTNLRAAHLVRTAGARQKDSIVAYHDRVRESILANLPKDACTAWHNRLAVALEGAGAVDQEALVIHWQEAGQPERAAGSISVTSRTVTACPPTMAGSDPSPSITFVSSSTRTS